MQRGQGNSKSEGRELRSRLGVAISKLLLDEESRSRMARRALVWSAEFDWEESAAAVLRAARRATSPAPAAAGSPHFLVRPAPVLAHEHLVRPALPGDAGVV